MTEQTLPQAAEARWIDVAEAAKMLRKQLKREFPGVKFSVRIDRYAGGSSIDITWTDGPTDTRVTTFVAGYRGARFDGMIDLQYSADSWYCDKHGARTAATHGHSYDRDDERGTGEGNGILASRCCAAAELVHFGSGYVHTRRYHSDEFRTWLEAETAKRCGVAEYNPSIEVGNYFMDQHLYQLERETER